MVERRISPPKSTLSALRTPLTVGEKKVLDFFDSNLPISWEIYIQPHLNGLRPDFVLLNPNTGIAVFEVKDWDLKAMSYYVKDPDGDSPELWSETREGIAFKRTDNPVDRVVRYKNRILELYCPSAEVRLVTAGVIVTTAQTQTLKQLFRPLYRKLWEKAPAYYPLVGIDTLQTNNIQAALPATKWSHSKLMKQHIAEELRGWLIEPEYEKDQRRPLELNSKQRRLSTTRTKSGYRRVRGAAGSGKSLVLAARAAQLSSEGKKVLVTSFNITLWHYLRDLAARYPIPDKAINSVTWLHFHQWIKEICCDAGKEKEYRQFITKGRKQGNLEGVLESDIIDLANKALDLLNEEYGNKIREYDAVLVDEGQDFNIKWWNILRRVLKADGEMLLVVDETQDLFNRSKDWTEEAMKGAGFSGPWLQLEQCYRMPNELITRLRIFAERYLKDNKVSLPKPPESTLEIYPVTLRWKQVQYTSLIAEECFNSIVQISKSDKEQTVAWSDFTVLLPTRKIGLTCEALFQRKGLQVAHIFGSDHMVEQWNERKAQKKKFWMGNGQVKLSSIHSFKGWESRYLIVALDNNTSLDVAYVAMSRLKRSTSGSYLTVICSNPGLAEFGQAWA